MIEAKRGWANTISTKQDYREITEGLGQRYEAALNTYKPFACGIVMHPAIDAAIQLRSRARNSAADQVKRIELKVHPLVLELTGKKTPAGRAGGQVQHLSCGRGRADRRRRRREAVQRPRRARSGRHRAPRQGRSRDRSVDQAGAGRDDDRTERRPRAAKADRARDRKPGEADERRRSRAKFADLAEGILPKQQTAKVMELCWKVEGLADAGEIARMGSRPSRLTRNAGASAASPRCPRTRIRFRSRACGSWCFSRRRRARETCRTRRPAWDC